MPESTLNIMAVVGSLNQKSATRVVVRHLAQELADAGTKVEVLDLLEEPLPLFNPDTSRQGEAFTRLQNRVERADVFVLGTPDYHGSMSSALKNFLDHFWHEFVGKLFVSVIASHEKGLTVADQIRTVARQCYAWCLPYGVSFTDQVDVKNQQIASEALLARLRMLARDARVYGHMLATQRRDDLACAEPGFMARWRKP